MTFFSLTPATVLEISRAHGVDYSKYDLQFHPETATGQLNFGVQRISYWLTRDELFETLLPGTLRLPIRGGYHYLASAVSWRDQVNAFVSYTNGLPFHFFVCDFEGLFNTLSVPFAYDAWRWIQEVQQRTGKKTILYTGRYLYQDWMVPSQGRYGIDWNTIDLWEAESPLFPNPATGNPTQPVGRTAPWRLWQYTYKLDGTKYGLGRPTAGDGNVFNGTVSDMRAWLELGDPPTEPPPPTGGSMYQCQVKSSATPHVNIRAAASGSSADIGNVYPGDQFTADRLENGFLHAIVPFTGYVAAQYCDYTLIPDPPPPGTGVVNLQITLQDNVATEVIVNGQVWVKPA